MTDAATPPSSFLYRGRAASGQEVTGTIDAAGVDEARALLESLRVEVTELELADRPRRTAAVAGADFALFNQQLAHLTDAGLPVERGLRLIAQETRSRRMAESIRRVAEEIERGRPLGEAFRAYRGEFPPLYGELIDAGVAGGNLPAMLFNLNRHTELVTRLRTAVWHAVAYPLVVALALLLVIVVLGVAVLPQFAEIYEDFDTELPGMTAALLRAAGWAPWVAGGLMVAIALLPVAWRVLQMSGRDAYVVDAVVTPVPLIGPVLTRSLTARWCDAVRVGVEAGMDLPRACMLAARAIGAPSLQRDAEATAGAIAAGRPMAAARLRLLPVAVPAAMDLATGRDALARTLATLTEMYRQQAETRIGAVNVLLTPILLLIVALVIGFVVISLFLPMIRLMQSVM